MYPVTLPKSSCRIDVEFSAKVSVRLFQRSSIRISNRQTARLGEVFCTNFSKRPNSNSLSTDRKKDLVKLQLGEYVSLAKVETVLSMSPLVDSVCVYASSEQSYVVCLIVLNRKHGAALAGTLDVPTHCWDAVCSHPAVEAEVLNIVTGMAKKGKMRMGFLACKSPKFLKLFSRI